MRSYVWSSIVSIPLALLLLFSGHGSTHAAHQPFPPSIFQLSTGDNDGDGIPDDLDPDDDNDGIVDSLDPAPYDPAIPGAGTEPPPDPLAPDQDTDGDGIPNDLDPDDNNDGVTDEDEIVATAIPSPTPAPALSPTAPPAVPATSEAAAPPPIAAPVNANPSQAEIPQVTSLPSTGSGDGIAAHGLAMIAGIAVMAMILERGYSRFSANR